MRSAAKFFFVIFLFPALVVAAAKAPAKRLSTMEQIKIGMDEIVEPVSEVANVRTERRVGLGYLSGSDAGTNGGFIEFNFTEFMAGSLGYGAGEGFNSFSLRLKQHLTATNVSPYFAFGYSRWFGTDRAVSATKPSFLAEKYLTAQEKLNGDFTRNFLFPALGVQWVVSTGPLAGVSLFAELAMLVELSSIDEAGTGAVGAAYYF